MMPLRIETLRDTQSSWSYWLHLKYHTPALLFLYAFTHSRPTFHGDSNIAIAHDDDGVQKRRLETVT